MESIQNKTYSSKFFPRLDPERGFNIQEAILKANARTKKWLAYSVVFGSFAVLALTGTMMGLYLSGNLKKSPQELPQAEGNIGGRGDALTGQAQAGGAGSRSLDGHLLDAMGIMPTTVPPPAIDPAVLLAAQNTDIVENVQDAVENVAETVSETASNFADGLGDMTGNVADFTGDMFDNVADATDNFIGDAFDNSLDTPFEDMLENMQDFNGFSMENIADMVDENLDTLHDRFEDINEGIQDNLSDGQDDVNDLIEDVLEQAREGFDDLFEDSSDMEVPDSDTMHEAIEDILEDVIEGNDDFDDLTESNDNDIDDHESESVDEDDYHDDDDDDSREIDDNNSLEVDDDSESNDDSREVDGDSKSNDDSREVDDDSESNDDSREVDDDSVDLDDSSEESHEDDDKDDDDDDDDNNSFFNRDSDSRDSDEEDVNDDSINDGGIDDVKDKVEGTVDRLHDTFDNEIVLSGISLPKLTSVDTADGFVASVLDKSTVFAASTLERPGLDVQGEVYQHALSGHSHLGSIVTDTRAAPDFTIPNFSFGQFSAPANTPTGGFTFTFSKPSYRNEDQDDSVSGSLLSSINRSIEPPQSTRDSGMSSFNIMQNRGHDRFPPMTDLHSLLARTRL